MKIDSCYSKLPCLFLRKNGCGNSKKINIFSRPSTSSVSRTEFREDLFILTFLMRAVRTLILTDICGKMIV